MKRIALLLLVAACATQPQPRPVDPAMQKEIDRVEKLVAEQPTNQPFIYVLATIYDRVNDVPNVVRLLTRLDELGWQQGFRADSFANTGHTPEVRRITAKLDAREPKVSRATTAFTFPQSRNVRSEGSAYDPVDDVFYYSGSASTLLRVNRRGEIQELPIQPAGRKFGRLGMDVVPDRREIWVINGVLGADAEADEIGRSAVSVYDLRDGRLLRRVYRGSADAPSLLNDLTILADGTAFITDSARHDVLRLAPGADTFEVFAKDFRGPNGVETSADERTLYVADFRGLNRFDIATQARELLKASALLNGIDGLVEHRGTLIGIQNVLGAPRVMRIHVNDGNRVELLESKNPLMNVPATGVVAGDEYFFLANLSEKDADKVVLKIKL